VLKGGHPLNSNVKELPRHRLWQPVTAKWFFWVFGVSVSYAVLRYHIVGDVGWQHFPLFIFNKATSLAAIIFVAAAYLIGKVIHWHDNDRYIRLVVIKFCGLIGFFLAGIHSLLSLALLSPAYFSKYFAADGRLNFEGELALAVGVVALFFLLGPAITSLPMMPKALGGIRWKRNQRLGYVALALVIVHLIALGLRGWLTPTQWQGWLPPISLIACAAACFPLLIKKRLSRHSADKNAP
jgi:DMSO/TMAO reductase YedYZ heme-binding membrane subunit